MKSLLTTTTTTLVLLVAFISIIITPQSSSAQTCPTLPPSTAHVSFPDQFYTCYDSGDAAAAAACMQSAWGLSTACASCLQTAQDCVKTSCSCDGAKTPTCVSCSNTKCLANLQKCSGQGGLTFSTCTDLLCNAAQWVLPVIISMSILGGILLLSCCLVLRAKYKSIEHDDDDKGFSCCPCCKAAAIGDDMEMTDVERQARLDRLRQSHQPPGTPTSSMGGSAQNVFASVGGGSAARAGASTRSRGPGSNAPTPKTPAAPGGFDDDDNFDMTMPDFVRNQGSTSSTVPRSPVTDAQIVDERASGSNGEVVVEHSIRASRLPADFRKSFQPAGLGLSPDMIFNQDTVTAMKSANAAAVPNAVIASHKALKMMGVQEADVQKPFSEPVTERIERLAKVANKLGQNVGGATAGLGNEIAEGFTKKRKEAEERAILRRKAEVEREEQRIRKDIEKEVKEERKQRDSQRMNSEDARRLTESMRAKKQERQSGGTAGQSKLAQFLQGGE